MNGAGTRAGTAAFRTPAPRHGSGRDSAPSRVPAASQTTGSTDAVTNRTLPSHMHTFAPLPACRLLAGETISHQLFGRQHGWFGGSRWLYQPRQGLPSLYGY